MQEKSVSEILAELISGKNGKSNPSTQIELQKTLTKMGMEVNQSSISRALKKIGATKTKDEKGNIVYKLVDTVQQTQGKIVSVKANEMMVVVKTAPGMAQWAAYHLDLKTNNKILGTLAGDDTIFIAPTSIKKINETLKFVKDVFSEVLA